MNGCKTARYVGVRFPGGKVRVVVEDQKRKPVDLPMRQDIVNHSPDGAEWGYFGSGPSQLALAMCVHAGGEKNGQRVYHFIKETLVAPIQDDSWVIKAAVVRTAMAARLWEDRRLIAFSAR